MPPSACCEAAVAAGRRAGERAALVAEQLALEQRLGQRGAVQLHERALGARAALVDRGRDQLLAGAALAGDQHAGARRRDLRDGLEHLLHRRGVADDVREAVLLGQPLAQLARLRAQPALLQLALDHDGQLVDVDRLGQVVGGARAHGRDRGLDRAERGHHDHRQVGVALAQACQQLDAVHAGHLQVGEHQVGRELLQLAQRLEPVGGGLDLVALVAQELGERGARVDLVVDDQDASLVFHLLRCSRRGGNRRCLLC